jgi:hypothetical protein
MEARACLDMVVEMHDRYHCIVDSICCDDDASTRAMVKWSNADWMINNNSTVGPRVLITNGQLKGKTKPRESTGRLPGHIPEPSFVADPNHRRKILMKELIGIAKLKVKERHTMTTMDATRIEKNFSYMIRQLPKMPEDQYEVAGQAVLYHHFDCHDYCGLWCKRKGLSEEERKLPHNRRYYRSLTKDAALFNILQPIVQRFITIERLKEVAHGMDTQCNESFNNTFSWLAPKNKVYCGSQSLRNRLSIGIGINTIGHLHYFTRLYEQLGIIMTPNVRHFLATKETKRTKRILKRKTVDSKKHRRRQKYEKQRRDEATAIKERKKRDGTYKTAQNMEDILEDAEDATGEVPGIARKKTPTKCPYCGKKNHKTTKSMHCLQNPAYLARMTAPAAPTTAPDYADILLLAAAAANDESEVEEIDDLYCRPITADPPTDEDTDVLETGSL